MRWVFAMLVVINLAFAGWLYWLHWIDHPLADSQPIKVLKGQSLLLLSELAPGELEPIKEKPAIVQATAKPPDAPADDEAAQNTNNGPDKPSEPQPARCLRVDGLTSKQASDGLSEKITARHLTVHDRGEAFEEQEVYWVYIPALKNRADADAVIKQLARKRAKDYLLVRSGEYENAVSLGLFSQREGAEKRLKEIKALRIHASQPEILTKASTVRRYWLMVEEGNQEEQARLASLLKSENLSTESVECNR